ncbi:hypothetical protein TNCV_1883011 [Trichonephila clavipes]|nr:hypothetical protein TNCV_1883011 [Trichonephila clavipes]
MSRVLALAHANIWTSEAAVQAKVVSDEEWRKQPIRARAYCAYWALRCMSRCPESESESRISGQSEPRLPVFKSPSKLGTHLSIHCSRDARLSRPCPAREENLDLCNFQNNGDDEENKNSTMYLDKAEDGYDEFFILSNNKSSRAKSQKLAKMSEFCRLDGLEVKFPLRKPKVAGSMLTGIYRFFWMLKPKFMT